MKKKDLTELKGKTAKDLAKLAGEKKLEAKKTKMEISAGKNKNLKAFRNLRKDIAQILTLIQEKQIMEKLQKEGEGKSQ